MSPTALGPGKLGDFTNFYPRKVPGNANQVMAEQIMVKAGKIAGRSEHLYKVVGFGSHDSIVKARFSLQNYCFMFSRSKHIP